jgi:hypothetical protein
LFLAGEDVYRACVDVVVERKHLPSIFFHWCDGELGVLLATMIHSFLLLLAGSHHQPGAGLPKLLLFTPAIIGAVTEPYLIPLGELLELGIVD